MRFRAMTALGLARARRSEGKPAADPRARQGLEELAKNGLGDGDVYAYGAEALAEILERQGAADEGAHLARAVARPAGEGAGRRPPSLRGAADRAP